MSPLRPVLHKVSSNDVGHGDGSGSKNCCPMQLLHVMSSNKDVLKVHCTWRVLSRRSSHDVKTSRGRERGLDMMRPLFERNALVLEGSWSSPRNIFTRRAAITPFAGSAKPSTQPKKNHCFGRSQVVERV